jgi:hypothetical protein
MSIKHLCRAARDNGLFLFRHRGRWEFSSLRTGKPLLFFEAGRYWLPGGERGLASGPMAALQRAIDVAAGNSK